MTVINTNVGALTARTYALQANDAMQKSMERLSSGLRINSAADDAAGLAVANKMESQLRGINVAIRNSQDGISLVQTAESGMSEISNMVIRMRELAVQMNNGVYSDADRANAQLEVSALLAEVDKIASNTAFNDVKVLDGTYSKDIRAGNTNAEVITVTIDRMNTDTIGGNYITTAKADAAKTSNTSLTSTTKVSVREGDAISLAASTALSGEFANTAGTFVNTYSGGTYSISGTDAAKFKINSSSGLVELANNVATLDFETKVDADTDGVYKFDVTYSKTVSGTTHTFVDSVELTVTDSTAPNTNTAQSGTTAMTTAEAATGALTLAASTNTSAKFKEFVAANAGGSYSLGGADAGNFSVTANTGAITNSSALNFEAPSATAGGNVHSFDIVYTALSGVTFTESVALTVTDSNLDTGTSPVTNVVSDVATAGKTKIAATVDSTTNGGLQFDLSASGANGWDKLSSGAKTFLLAEGFSSAALVAGTNTGAALNADNTNIDLSSALATGATSTITVDITGGNGGTFREKLTFDITQTANGGAESFGAKSAVAGDVLDTASTASFNGGTSGGEALNIDLTAGAKFAKLNAFSTAHSGGTYAVSLTSQVGGVNTFTLGSNGTSVNLAKGHGAGTHTATVTYTQGGNIFTQNISIVTTAAADPTANAANTATVTTSADSATATRDSTEVKTGKSSLTFVEAREGSIKSIGTNKVLSAALDTFASAHPKGTFTVTGTDKDLFTIDATTGDVKTKANVDFETKSSYALNVVYTQGTNVYTETVDITVIDSATDAGTHLADVNLSTASGSSTAVTILDKALSQISSSQAKLGAIQNRLQHNIDNLSMASMLTETARGRVVDADFAKETSELSKQQILGQAATSMLAQANQSKQSVLALLQ